MAETVTEPTAEKRQKAEQEEEERIILRGKGFDIIEKRRHGWVAPEEHRSWHTSANIKQAYLLAKRLIIIIAFLSLSLLRRRQYYVLYLARRTETAAKKSIDGLAEVHRHLERFAQLINVAIVPVLFNGTID